MPANISIVRKKLNTCAYSGPAGSGDIKGITVIAKIVSDPIAPAEATAGTRNILIMLKSNFISQMYKNEKIYRFCYLLFLQYEIHDFETACFHI